MRACLAATLSPAPCRIHTSRSTLSYSYFLCPCYRLITQSLTTLNGLFQLSSIISSVVPCTIQVQIYWCCPPLPGHIIYRNTSFSSLPLTPNPNIHAVELGITIPPSHTLTCGYPAFHVAHSKLDSKRASRHSLRSVLDPEEKGRRSRDVPRAAISRPFMLRWGLAWDFLYKLRVEEFFFVWDMAGWLIGQ